MTSPMPPMPAPPPMPPQKSGLALASMILGIVGIALCLGPLAGIPAVICGHMARAKIRQSGGALSGVGMATAGLITGYLAIVSIVFIGLLAAIAVPNFVRARQASQRAACVTNLRAIDGAKAVWALESRKTQTDVPTEADLAGPGKQLSEMPVCPAGGTYSLNPVDVKPACSIPGHEF